MTDKAIAEMVTDAFIEGFYATEGDDAMINAGAAWSFTEARMELESETGIDIREINGTRSNTIFMELWKLREENKGYKKAFDKLFEEAKS